MLAAFFAFGIPIAAKANSSSSTASLLGFALVKCRHDKRPRNEFDLTGVKTRRVKNPLQERNSFIYMNKHFDVDSVALAGLALVRWSLHYMGIKRCYIPWILMELQET